MKIVASESGDQHTLESLIIVPLVIKVQQSNGGVKIVLYDFLIAISLLS